MELNHSIKVRKLYVRASWFTKNPADSDEFHPAYLFGIQSCTGKCLTFHVMTDYGMLRSRVPISEIFTKPVAASQDVPYHFKQLWDCFSENVAVVEYEYLQDKRCEVVLRDGSKVWASYLFTVDWYSNGYSDEPSDYKCGHVLAADAGYLLCQPNNRIYWRDQNWITRDFPIEPKRIKVDTWIPSVETVSDRWVSEDTDNYYYSINGKNDEKQGSV